MNINNLLDAIATIEPPAFVMTPARKRFWVIVLLRSIRRRKRRARYRRSAPGVRPRKRFSR